MQCQGKLCSDSVHLGAGAGGVGPWFRSSVLLPIVSKPVQLSRTDQGLGQPRVPEGAERKQHLAAGKHCSGSLPGRISLHLG